MSTRIIEVRRGIHEENDELAHRLRTRFQAEGVFVVNLVSAPGSGKTALLQRTLAALRPDLRTAALVGDLATDNDATRLAQSGAPVRQICTGTTCHLEAWMVEDAIDGWRLDEIDILFIENVGNLVAPARYDLGERLRAVLFSVTEGEDKPLKYPTIFNTADVVVLTKVDLADVVEFDRELAYQSIRRVRPRLPIIETSARREDGMKDWLEMLVQHRAEAGTRGAVGEARPAGGSVAGM